MNTNPNGVPQGPCAYAASGVEPRRGSGRFRVPDLGCAVATATPDLLCDPVGVNRNGATPPESISIR